MSPASTYDEGLVRAATERPGLTMVDVQHADEAVSSCCETLTPMLG